MRRVAPQVGLGSVCGKVQEPFFGDLKLGWLGRQVVAAGAGELSASVIRTWPRTQSLNPAGGSKCA
jgi:hypothetical protein